MFLSSLNKIIGTYNYCYLHNKELNIYTMWFTCYIINKISLIIKTINIIFFSVFSY